MRHVFMPYRSLVIAMFVVVLGVVGGCVRSVSPVLHDDQVITDNNILGRWNSTENQDEYIEVSPETESSYKAVYHEKNGNTGIFVVRLGKMGGLTIAEVGPDKPPVPDKTSGAYMAHLVPVYSFYVLVQTQPDLVGRTIKPDWLKEYVKAHPGELATTLKDDLLITSSTDDLQAFIVKHYPDKDAFAAETRLVRPGASTRPATDAAGH
jgi:hypothetical protein